jgi:phosphatidylglycerol:prolipoprotein diacylglycerol transferase
MLPRLFHIGSFDLPAYGTLVAIGVFFGILLSARLAQTQGIDPNVASKLGIIAALSGIVGAKILFILMNGSFYWRHPSEILSASLQAGGVFSGGLLAALMVCAVYIRHYHLPVLRTADAFAPALAMGHAIGRLGCFAAGCCYGRPTVHAWGVVFTDPLAHELSGTPLGVRVEPTQLFEAAVELTNFFVHLWLLSKKRFDGQVIGSYLLLYGVARFFLEFLRGDPGRGEVLGGSISGTQLIAIGLTGVGALLWAANAQMKTSCPSPKVKTHNI